MLKFIKSIYYNGNLIRAITLKVFIDKDTGSQIYYGWKVSEAEPTAVRLSLCYEYVNKNISASWLSMSSTWRQKWTWNSVYILGVEIHWDWSTSPWLEKIQGLNGDGELVWAINVFVTFFIELGWNKHEVAFICIKSELSLRIHFPSWKSFRHCAYAVFVYLCLYSIDLNVARHTSTKRSYFGIFAKLISQMFDSLCFLTSNTKCLWPS